MDIIARINDFIVRHKLLKKEEKYIVALSGGADSVMLLSALKQLGYTIEAAHCNFHLRGEESDRDENFCRKLCEKNNIPFHFTHFDTKTYATLHKISIEMAARNLRYGYFKQLCRYTDASAVCVAHHKDDSVETVLINLIRGTGLHGLTGISPINGDIIRPLLCVTRNEIEDYLKTTNQDFVTDSTNLMDDVTRNKIRLNIIPMLEKINPNARESIYKTVLRLKEAEKILDNELEEARKRVSGINGNQTFVNIKELEKEVSVEYTLYHILKGYGFSPSQIEQISCNIDAQTGKMWSSNTHQLLIDRDRILIEPVKKNIEKKIRIPFVGTYIYDENIKLSFNIKAIDNDFRVSKEKNHVCLDADKVKFPLTIRNTEKADKFVPFGMKGTKLVSDYMTDAKKNLFDKRKQLVLTDADNNIIWLVNERPDNRFRITEASINVLSVCIN